jgi:LacI family transcriptional regulator, galactose operon repressor
VKRRKHITLEDIARRLKVSRVTVSKALRGHPDISAEMTQRVQKTANELGYTPNIIARSLSSRRSNMMGLVVPKIAHSFFGAVIEGVYNTAFENKYETILTVSQENTEREKTHLQTLVAMRVDGIIISISQETEDTQRFKRIRTLGIPLVFIDRRPEPALSGFSTVLVDDRAGAYQAVEQAIRVGYKRLGLIGGNTNVNIGKERLRGFEDALREYRLKVNREWIVPGGYGRDDGYAAMKSLYASGSLPEFILAMTYPIALGIFEACRELGLQIPQDVDIICFGDSEAGRFVSPSLSVVEQPAYEMGARAVQLLLQKITEHDVTREHHIILPTQLVLRETCVARHAQAGDRAMVDDAVEPPAIG